MCVWGGRESFQRRELPEPGGGVGGAVGFTPVGGEGKGSGTKSLPTEPGAVRQLKGTLCCGRGRAGCASLRLG